MTPGLVLRAYRRGLFPMAETRHGVGCAGWMRSGAGCQLSRPAGLIEDPKSVDSQEY
jgi:Leu/Phe-tRNA-protein transferase